MVVADRAAGGERVVEPEPVLGGDGVGRVRERRGALVGRDHQVRVVLVAHADPLRRHDHAVDEVVGDVEQRADVRLVGLLDHRLVDVRPLDDEAALGARRDDDRVLGQLRPHQAVDLGAVVHAVREADPAAGDRAAAQVDALDVGRVDVDLERGSGQRDRRHVGRAQLERRRAPSLLVGVGPQGGVDRSELVAQDAVVVDRRDVLEISQDLLPQRGLGRLVGLDPRVEAQLEVAHELGRDRRVGRQHVVLVALGEARAEPLAVLAIRAQDRHLRAVEPGRDHKPVERVGLVLTPVDGGDRVAHAIADGVEVERELAGAEHPELLHPRLLVAEQPGGDLLDHAQPEVLEHRHHARELDLGAALVERDAGRSAQRVQADGERLAVGQAREVGDVDRPHFGRRVALVMLREALRPAGVRRPLRGERGGEVVVPGPGEREHLLLELGDRHLGQAVGRIHGEVHAHALALVEHVVGVDARGLEAAAQERGQPRHERRAVARPRQRDDRRRAAPVGRAPREHAHAIGPLEPGERHDDLAQLLHRRREQLLLRERVEQRDGCLVVVRALDQVLGVEHLPQLAVQHRRLGRALGIGLGGEQPQQPRLADDLARARHAAHADVVHALVPVHGRERVGLVHEQQVAAHRPVEHGRRQLA